MLAAGSIGVLLMVRHGAPLPQLGVQIAALLLGALLAPAIAALGRDRLLAIAPWIAGIGVALLGIDSNFCPAPRREQAWARLAAELDRDKLRSLTRTVRWSDLGVVAAEIVEGKVRGRTVVEID